MASTITIETIPTTDVSVTMPMQIYSIAERVDSINAAYQYYEDLYEQCE